MICDAEQPLVSIAVTTYNGAKYLRAQLDSLLAQDYSNVEILVADDGSSDATLDILREYESQPNFTWWQNENNLGYIKNFESVIEKCSGQFIALCDQDDIWYPGKISHSLAKLREDDALLAYCDADLIASDDTLIGANLLSHSISGPISGTQYRKFYLLNTINGCTAVISRELFEMATPFPREIPHDWWLAYVASVQGRLSFLGERLLGYRMHSNNTVGISYRVKKQNITRYIARKLNCYTRRYIYEKVVRPKKWTMDCLLRFRVFKEYESARGMDTGVLDELIQWVEAKLNNSSQMKSFKPFFEQHNAELGVKLRSLLFMTMRGELLRAKVKLAYTLLSPLLVVSLPLFVAWKFFMLVMA